MKTYQIYSSIFEGYQAFELAGSCDIHKEYKAAAEWFSNVGDDGFFEPVNRLPKYRWFVEHIENIDADLYYDYGADYFFLVREVLKNEKEMAE